jgi:membrane-bound serine protease (ClpP class)
MKRLLFLFTMMTAGLAASPLIAQETLTTRWLVLTVDNKVIGPVTADYIDQGITEAEHDGYAGVILKIDTPGGLLESTRVIVKSILNARVPVVVYIAPSGSRAGSAGVFITLAAHVAAMAPSTNIGAAHPVSLNGPDNNDGSLQKAIEELTQTLQQQTRPKTAKDRARPALPGEPAAPTSSSSGSMMEDKILNDTLAWIETIARSRGRNAEWAKRAVRESISVPETEALAQKIIDLIAVDENDLLKKLDGRTIQLPSGPMTLKASGATLVRRDMSPSQNALNALIHPNIAYILMILGVIGLFIEITHPGVLFPGIAGIICLVLAFYAFSILPINYAGLFFVGLGLLLFIAEALTPASFGLLTLSGGVCMVLGSLMLVDSSFFGLGVGLNIILPFVLALAAIVIFLATNVLRAHTRKVQTGPQTLLGQVAVAQEDFIEEGLVFATGEIWTAINKSGAPIRRDEKLRIIAIDKVKLVVSK